MIGKRIGVILAAFTLFAASATAQRPANVSICDFYTTAVFRNNTDANQLTLLTLIVNTAVIGSYSPAANASVRVPGILAAEGGLAPYFNGDLATTNVNDVPTRVNFLDGGGATPLTMNMPANSQSSRQFTLMTHLYQFFGSLLGCSRQGTAVFPDYEGRSSMFTAHKFMNLNKTQMDFFITQVALTARSFGVAESDIGVVGTALNNLFNFRCSPPTALPDSAPALQSICIASSCPADPNANCALYASTASSTTARASSTSAPAPASTAATTAAAPTPSTTAPSTASPSATARSGAGMVLPTTALYGLTGVLVSMLFI